MRAPLQRFIAVETSSALLLLASAITALLWANSPWSSSYHAFWEKAVVLGVGSWTSAHSLRFWVDDGLMAVFFLVVGLEIRGELHDGALADRKRAALPAVAALGGMLVPALLYLAVNREAPARHGWAIPTATDIAFAVGILGLLGTRVPPGLRSFLLALAIIDDLGAIVLIAVFYAGSLQGFGFVVAAAGVALVWLLQRAGVRRALVYLVPGGLVWWGMSRAGVHPAIAGALLGFMTPVARREPDEAVAPAAALQARLHPWVAYGVMPIFALSSAGVTLGAWPRDATTAPIVGGIVLGLVVGKPLGIFLASMAAVKLRVAAFPRGVTWRAVLTLGCIGGIGFTVSMFIVGLAFRDSAAQEPAKLAVLSGSALAAIVGLLLGRFLLPLPLAANEDERSDASRPA